MINNSKFFFTINIISFIFFLLIFLNNSYGFSNKLPLPRFATIKSTKANARKGPGKDCLIEWIFIKKGEPVEIITEYEQWREVKDINGICGWVHVSVLSGKRSAIIIGNDPTLLYKKPDDTSQILAKLMPNLRCQLKKCIDDYCLLQCSEVQGWVAKQSIWGAYKEEKF